jgi:hypothetical protein
LLIRAELPHHSSQDFARQYQQGIRVETCKWELEACRDGLGSWKVGKLKQRITPKGSAWTARANTIQSCAVVTVAHTDWGAKASWTSTSLSMSAGCINCWLLVAGSRLLVAGCWFALYRHVTWCACTGWTAGVWSHELGMMACNLPPRRDLVALIRTHHRRTRVSHAPPSIFHEHHHQSKVPFIIAMHGILSCFFLLSRALLLDQALRKPLISPPYLDTTGGTTH